jgi:hypothetical protein
MAELLDKGVIFRLAVRSAKPAIFCGCKFCPAKAVAGRLGAILVGVMVTWSPKRRQRVDLCSMECVGIHAAKCGTRFDALQPIKQVLREHFGHFGPLVAKGLTLRHDHGSHYMTHDFQAEIDFLEIESSPAFVWTPECNGCAERFVRILNENLRKWCLR